jgi:putative thioredoxin
MLEKLEVDYEGRFKLVKINSDQEQQLAAAFGIKQHPDLHPDAGGQPVDGFMGALPEGKMREFLDKHLPGEHELAAQADAQEAQQHLESGDVHAALERLGGALAANPGNDDIRFDYVKLLIGAGQLGDAAAALAPGLAQIPVPLRFEALSQWLNAMEFAATDARALEQFDQKIAENRRDFETRFAKSRVLMAMAAGPSAMDELLEIIMRDKQWNEAAPRKTFVAILELLTPPRPKAGDAAPGKTAGGIELAGKSAVQEDPQAALVSAYRRKLSMMLN